MSFLISFWTGSFLRLLKIFVSSTLSKADNNEPFAIKRCASLIHNGRRVSTRWHGKQHECLNREMPSQGCDGPPSDHFSPLCLRPLAKVFHKPPQALGNNSG